MHQKREFRYTETETLQIVELPYRGGEVSMLVLLPKKLDGVKETEASLSVENLRQWKGEMLLREVAVHLPKFTITLGVPLKEVLEKMGMVEAFKPEAANFAGMDGSAWFYISEVIHKAFINVDEEGTEAAAASAVIRAVRGSPPPVVFRADHPFVFLIQENRTGSILFIGRVTDPTQGGEG
jgi:serpin B